MMTDFQWLSEDKRVQCTEFGDTVEILANFGTDAFGYKDVVILAQSVIARQIGRGEIAVFSVL